MCSPTIFSPAWQSNGEGIKSCWCLLDVHHIRSTIATIKTVTCTMYRYWILACACVIQLSLAYFWNVGPCAFYFTAKQPSIFQKSPSPNPLGQCTCTSIWNLHVKFTSHVVPERSKLGSPNVLIRPTGTNRKSYTRKPVATSNLTFTYLFWSKWDFQFYC